MSLNRFTQRIWIGHVLAGLVLFAGVAEATPPDIYFQAHRGGLEERPENTLVALEYAWSIPGAVPELDLRTTREGVLVGIHDSTPKRTLMAPPDWADKSIREIPLELLQQWDAGSYFDATYKDARVPTFEDVLDRLATDSNRQLYLDLKDVDNAQVIDTLKARKVTAQIIFVHGSPEECSVLSQSWPGARTMTWLSGSPVKIKSRFRALAAGRFEGISQIQLHLKPAAAGVPGSYELGDDFLTEATRTVAKTGTMLQVRPFVFDTKSLRALIERGIHWYVADAPMALRNDIEAALAK